MVIHRYKDKTQPIDIEKSAKWLRSSYATWILAAISFTESVFLPVIIDPFLIAMIFASRKKWILYILVSVIASTLGGVFAYLLGSLFFETVGVKLLLWSGLESSFTLVSEGLGESGFVFVLLGAFTPIPYKLVALASGLLHINFVTFIVASTIGRLFRLGLVGYAAYKVGPTALPIIRRNLHLFAAIVGVALTAYILIQILL